LLVAGSVHTVKSAAVRPAITAATGGTANVPVSIVEDVISTVLSILSVVVPVLVGIFLVLLVSLIIWWVWRRANRKHQAVS
jgi:Flp pilus assembly protein TadB